MSLFLLLGHICQNNLIFFLDLGLGDSAGVEVNPDASHGRFPSEFSNCSSHEMNPGVGFDDSKRNDDTDEIGVGLVVGRGVFWKRNVAGGGKFHKDEKAFIVVGQSSAGCDRGSGDGGNDIGKIWGEFAVLASDGGGALTSKS